MHDEPTPVSPELSTLLTRGTELGVSHIHLEPGAVDTVLRFRVDGVLRKEQRLPAELAAALNAELRRVAGPDQDGIPSDGQFTVRDGGKPKTWAVTCVPGRHGDRFCLTPYGRPQMLFELDRLGFDPTQVDLLRAALHDQRPGMMVVTGPTGSGKNTTIYSLLRELHDQGRTVATAEWEFRGDLPGIHQVLVNTRLGLDFAALCRAYLRSDVDAIFLREIENYETAEVAFRAVLNQWRRLLTALHCSGVADTGARFSNMGIEPWIVAKGISVIQGQRLLRRLCDRCKAPVRVPVAALVDAGLESAHLDGVELCKPTGCEACGGTGYRGLVVVAETYRFSEEFRGMLCDGAGERVLARLAMAEGMRTLRQSGLRLAAKGITSLEQVLLYTPTDG